MRVDTKQMYFVFILITLKINAIPVNETNELYSFEREVLSSSLDTSPNIGYTTGGFVCPVSNPNYKVISGSCYYFEDTSTMTYADAQLNCQDKFGNLVGGLIEPRLASTNKLVYAEASNFKSATSDDFWLGINDLATQGQYVYASDGQEVVDGMWKLGQPSSAAERCASYFHLASQYDANAGWYDRPCNDYKFSICQPIGCCSEKCRLFSGSSGSGGTHVKKLFDASSISDAIKIKFFEEGVAWARSITKSSQTMNLAIHGSTKINWMNSRGSPGVSEMGESALAMAHSAMLMLTNSSQSLIGNQGLVNWLPETLAKWDLQDCSFTDPLQQPKCNDTSIYRTINGECNNLKKPFYGRSFTPLARVLDSAFEDGIQAMRSKATSGKPLHSTRFISTTIRNPESQKLSQDFTALYVAFAQFVDHDTDHVPMSEDNGPIECCDGTGDDSDETKATSLLCFPIEVPIADTAITPRCLNFVRSVPSPNLECSGSPIEQLNQITHWLDNSNVYGSLPEVAKSVRSNQDGLLKVKIVDGQEQLPIDTASNGNCLGDTRDCALAGDLRVNEQPPLGAMHTLFLREHNRVARKLTKLNAEWKDERLFQESRRVVNAQFQHIVYNEFLPILIGKKGLDKFGISPLTKGFSTNYKDDFDPRVTNEFATAAFRVGHTLIPDIITTFTKISRKAKNRIRLTEVFSNGDILRQPNFFDELLRGMTIEPSEDYDNNFVPAVSNELFDDGQFGLDLIALNIQRGRDHGLPGYIHYRECCGGSKITSFDQLGPNISQENIANLKKAYESVEDIDLFAGLTLEKKFDDALIGETFICLIADVFARLRFGDRFFYDLEGQKGSFKENQLDQIRQASMARLICDNTNIDIIQPMAFRLADNKINPEMSCNDKRIPKVDLSAFKVVHPDVKLLEKLAKTNELGYKLEDAIKSNLKDDVSSNNDAITSNDGDISTLQDKFDGLQADYNALKAGIQTNADSIKTNANSIQTNANVDTTLADIITSMQANITNIDAHIQEMDTDINGNIANIATNNAEISNNEADIITNVANIATNSANVAINNADIAKNNANITSNDIDIALNAANISKNAADIFSLKPKEVVCPTSESGYRIVNNKCIYVESSHMSHANAKLNCLAKMEPYGFGRLFEPKSKSMNDLVATEAINVFGNSWVWIGFNDIATDETYVFDSDDSPVLSAFSPKWYGGHGPGGSRDSLDCGLLLAHSSSVYLGDWAEGSCESASTRRSICE